MKKNKLFLLVTLLAAFVLVLAACNGGNETDDPTDDTGGVTNLPSTDPTEPGDTEPSDDVPAGPDSFQALYDALAANNLTLATQNDAPILDGGTLRFALGAVSANISVLEPTFSRWTTELDIRQFTHEELLVVGEDFFPRNDANSLASASFDREARTLTITKNHESTWADGEPLTLDDLLFAYEVIAHPDYTGPRFDANVRNVVGILDYHNGDADHIAGLTLSDDQMELTIEFYEVNPYTFAFAFWSSPMPRHHWEGIAVADMEAHPNARYNVLGNGPFIIVGSVPNESYHFARNENFWRGPAILDEVIFEVVEPMQAPEVMRAGMYDVMNFPQSLFTAENRGLSNISFLANPFASTASWWLGFRMGDWDDDAGRVAPWAEPRLSQEVRTALALSMDHAGAGYHFFNGLVVPSGSVYWPLNRINYIDRTLPTYNSFDLERANQILDDAGYLFVGDDEFRSRPDGSPLVVVYAAQTGSVANENNRQLELDNWRYDLGVDVRLYQDRLVSSDVFWDAIELHTSNEIDMFTFGVGFGANPTPTWCCSPISFNNHIRFTSPEWEAAFDRFTSEEMWDESFRAETIQHWQETVSASYVMFPTTTAIGLTAVNNRVTNFSVENTFGDMNRPGNWNTWLWALTAEDTYVAD